MAEEGKSITQHIHVHVNASSLTDETTTVVHGDQVGTKMDVAAGRIGTVNIQGPNAENAGEEQIVEDVEEMNLAKKKITSRSAISKPNKSIGKPGNVPEMSQTNTRARSTRKRKLTEKEKQRRTVSGSTREEREKKRTKQKIIVGGVEEMNLGRTESDDIPTRREIRQQSKILLGQPQGGVTKESSNELRGVKIAFLKERSNALLGQTKYIKAAPVLEEISSLEGTMNFDTCLQMVECYLHLGREIKANKATQALRDIIITSKSFTADDIYKLGSELVGNSSYIRGISLIRIASDMYVTNASTPDDIVNSIYSCINKTDDATQPLIDAGGISRVIGLDIGVENMIQMKQRLKAVKNAKPELKALKEAESNHLIGLTLAEAGENEKSIKFYKTGIEILERQFPSNAAQYSIYGALLQNLGTEHYELGKYSEAETYYVKAVEAHENAKDFGDESEKQKSIEQSKNDLKNTRAELGK